jgi:biotin synthase-like enzyme
MRVMELEASTLDELEDSIQVIKKNTKVSLFVTLGNWECPYMNLRIQGTRAYVHYFSVDDELASNLLVSRRVVKCSQ